MKASRYNIFVSNGDAGCAAGSSPLPAELAAKMLASDDWDFISRQTSRSVRQMFCRERKTIYLAWLGQMRRQVAQLMRVHRQRVHPNLGLSLAAELQRLGSAAIFYAVYAATQVLIRIRGPASAVSLIRNLAAMAERLRLSPEVRLTQPEPTHFDQDGVPSATGSAGERSRACRAKYLIRNLEVEAAIEEIKRRELSGLGSEFSGLTYLASVRDYNSARYYHEGLARRFTEEVMEQALATCHREVFRRLVCCSLEETVRQLDAYVRATPEPTANVLRVWTRLEPFRVLMPLGCDQLSADLFVSNVRVVLGILQDHVQATDHAYNVAELPIKS